MVQLRKELREFLVLNEYEQTQRRVLSVGFALVLAEPFVIELILIHFVCYFGSTARGTYFQIT